MVGGRMEDSSGGRGGGGQAAIGEKEMAAGANHGLNGNAPPPFLSKTYDMVDDSATDAIVSWGTGNNSFVVRDPPEFARDLLPKYFKHNNFSSFVRQLNTYGFRKVDPDRWEFANEGFLRGQKHLLKTINRRKPSHGHGQSQKEQPQLQPQPQSAPATACVELGKFGLEEEVEQLKRDKNVLMQELIRLRQQQQTSDHQLQTLMKRVQGMEQHQQQMMAFLAKAMRSPGFFPQFVQQNQNDSNRRITGVNKKRRLPEQEGSHDDEMLEGQIVKYQPLINEAAKSMLRQIIKMNASARLESSGNSDNLQLDNFQIPSEAFESTASQNSCVTLSEIPSNSGFPFVPTTSAVSDQSSAVANELIGPDDIGVLSIVQEEIAPSPTNIDIPDLPELLRIDPEDTFADIPVETLEIPKPQDLYANQNALALQEVGPLDIDDFSADTDINLFNDNEKLPGMIDDFWEQFMMASPLAVDTEEVESTTQEQMEVQPSADNVWNNTEHMNHIAEQMELQSSADNVWNNTEHMNHITEQMGLLSSAPKR